MRLVRAALVAVVAALGGGCNPTSDAPEKKELPPNRIPKTLPAPPKK